MTNKIYCIKNIENKIYKDILYQKWTFNNKENKKMKKNIFKQ